MSFIRIQPRGGKFSYVDYEDITIAEASGNNAAAVVSIVRGSGQDSTSFPFVIDAIIAGYSAAASQTLAVSGTPFVPPAILGGGRSFDVAPGVQSFNVTVTNTPSLLQLQTPVFDRNQTVTVTLPASGTGGTLGYLIVMYHPIA